MNVSTSAMLFAGLLLLGLAGDSGVQKAEAFFPASHAAALAAFSTGDTNEVIERYCTRCHSEQRQRGGLVLEGFDVDQAADHADIAERMIKKLRAGMMPPSGARRPEETVLAELALQLETTLDEAWRDNPEPGARVFQRLNRAEYAVAVEQLLGIRVDVSSYLPLDTKSANFDNIADVQMPSTTVVEGYLRAAGQISRLALGDPEAEIANTIYRMPRVASQKEQTEGAPFGTRGGLSVIHNFPADGKYVFHIMPYNAVEGEVFGRTYGTDQIEVSIDGGRVALMTIDRWMHESEPSGLNMRTDSIQVSAGPHRVTAAFVRQFEGDVDDLIRPIDHTLADGQIGIGYGVTTQQHLQRMTILGPFEVTGVSDTPTRSFVFSCRPTSPEEERPCAESIVRRLAERAYRRGIDDSDVTGLMQFYDQGSEARGFEGGIRLALQAIMASPHFIFRMERTPGGVEPGEVYDIADSDLASRLSFFMWGSPPDEELVDLAEKGDLSDDRTLERQVRRMLADPRAEALSSRFAAQWLRLQDLDKIRPDALSYPYFDQTLADAMLNETELLFNYIRTADRPISELLTADYTFVNERLARHYGIPGVLGTEFRMVQYPDETRRGILGHGSILTLTSHANRTSIVLRGKWVMEVLLGSPPPPPPPNVPALEETEGAADGRFLTVRERQAQHRANPACSSCHNVIDPIGLTFENFDVTGAWRARDGGNLVDTRGELYDGTPVNGVGDLRDAIMRRPEVFYRIFTENMMAYALGRRVEYFDMPSIRMITKEAGENDYRLSSFVLGIVNTPAFRSARASQAILTQPVTDSGSNQNDD
jgi:Protein of unknown function (DUF1592)/Protein of unknown function (DUF1588)/Protein of unknown function (DUF1595)/Protein of unknown function (DUF1585)/Protein of unknown function (DUF1587)